MHTIHPSMSFYHTPASSSRGFVTWLLFLLSYSPIWVQVVSGYGYDYEYDSDASASWCRNEALVLVEKPVVCLLGEDVDVDVLQGMRKGMWDGYRKNVESSSSPWTHAPICIPSQTGRRREKDGNDLDDAGEEEEEEEEEFCIFTNSTFHGGRGISIFTTPSIARDFSGLPAFHQPPSPSSSSFSSSDQHGAGRGKIWYTKHLPKKGTGMLAKKPLTRGEEVLRSQPVLLVNPERKMGRAEGEEVLGLAVGRLGTLTGDAYRGLARGGGDESWVVQNVLRSNDFEVQVGGKMHLAIFLEPARLNHDCAPNAQYYIDSESLTHYVHAVRPIAVDEEITISYTSPFQPAAARQEHLLKAFNFTCACQLCTTHEESDKDLAEIKSIQVILGSWDSETPIHFEEAGAKALKLIELYQKLNLHAFSDMPFGFASLVFNSFGKDKKAVRYARMAAEAVEMRYGPGAADFAMWQSIIEDPKGHWSWNYKVNR